MFEFNQLVAAEISLGQGDYTTARNVDDVAVEETHFKDFPHVTVLSIVEFVLPLAIFKGFKNISRKCVVILHRRM